MPGVESAAQPANQKSALAVYPLVQQLQHMQIHMQQPSPGNLSSYAILGLCDAASPPIINLHASIFRPKWVPAYCNFFFMLGRQMYPIFLLSQ
jgi:hypothetical protein